MQGWDKTYCLQFVDKEFDDIHFFGDKTFQVGGREQHWSIWAGQGVEAVRGRQHHRSYGQQPGLMQRGQLGGQAASDSACMAMHSRQVRLS